MNALVFLYKKVLKVQLDKEINAVRSLKKNKVPTVLSRKEVGDMLAVMEGVPQLVAKIIYDALSTYDDINEPELDEDIKSQIETYKQQLDNE